MAVVLSVCSVAAQPLPEAKPQGSLPLSDVAPSEDPASVLPLEKPEHPAADTDYGTASSEEEVAAGEASVQQPNPALVNWLEKAEFVPERCPIVGAEETVLPAQTGDGACGVVPAVSLKSVGLEPAIVLSGSPALTCDFASRFADYLSEDVQPMARRAFGESLMRIDTGPGYVCRRRNNRPDGKLSEHAKGKALDVLAFHLESGEVVSVEADWGKETDKGRFLKAVHAASCLRFMTVLGPDADPNHKNHFHFDNGCHGKTCTYRICQ